MPEMAPHITTNVALNKPALQSSISKWSSGKTIEADASVATNGDIASAAFFHTDRENTPWWQVDLQGEFVVDRIRIYNRRDIPERLKQFTVLSSLTGEPDSWLRLYCKDTEVTFGRLDDTPFVVTPDIRCITRFVRVRLDRFGILHFRECEVLGYPPDAEEFAQLHKQTLVLQQRQNDEQTRREHELTAGRHGYITKIESLSVFVDTDNYSPVLVRELTSGTYEARERRIVKDTVRATDRVLEIGTAIGAVTMTIATIVGPASVATYDANPAIIADARRNFAANALDGISANIGAMRNRSRWSRIESEIDFFISRDFWASRMDAAADSPGVTDVVKVPLVCLEDKIAEHRANVLIFDIEGGETDLLIGADLSPIRMIVMETHYWISGRRNTDAMMRFLVMNGFNINLNYTGAHVVVMDREI